MDMLHPLLCYIYTSVLQSPRTSFSGPRVGQILSSSYLFSNVERDIECHSDLKDYIEDTALLCDVGEMVPVMFEYRKEIVIIDFMGPNGAPATEISIITSQGPEYVL